MLNKKTGKYILYFLLFMNIGLLAGCKEDSSSQNAGQVSEVPSVTEEGVTDETEEPYSSMDNSTLKQELQASNNMKKISIYCITDDASDKESVTSMIPKDTEVSAQVIVDCVVSEFENQSLEIGIDSVQEEDGSVIVSFQSEKPPVANVGAGVEGLILDCISQSLLDNLDSCQKVIFRIEGKAYETGHFSFGVDEAYDWK